MLRDYKISKCEKKEKIIRYNEERHVVNREQ